jgi:hypothetical protein
VFVNGQEIPNDGFEPNLTDAAPFTIGLVLSIADSGYDTYSTQRIFTCGEKMEIRP